MGDGPERSVPRHRRGARVPVAGWGHRSHVVAGHGLPHLSVAPVFAITDEGIIAETWTGAAHTAGYAGSDHTPMDPIALGYVQAWASGDPTGIEALYAPAAGLRDSLRNLNLEHPAQPARTAARAGSSESTRAGSSLSAHHVGQRLASP